MIPSKIYSTITQLEDEIQFLPKEQQIKIYKVAWSFFEIGATQGCLLSLRQGNEYKAIKKYFKDKIDQMEKE